VEVIVGVAALAMNEDHGAFDFGVGLGEGVVAVEEGVAAVGGEGQFFATGRGGGATVLGSERKSEQRQQNERFHFPEMITV